MPHNLAGPTRHAAYPGWRSLLFIPVHVDKFVAKAHTRGADAYILDLEDSVPLAEKELDGIVTLTEGLLINSICVIIL